MGMGYDIGLSASFANSSSASNNSPFYVTGGGGSASTSSGAQSPISGTGTPTGVSAWLPYVLIGVVVLAAFILLFPRKGRR